MWAIGCVFVEMLSRKSLFQGNSDIQMLASITNVLGTIK
jgi:hypothetical protein